MRRWELVILLLGSSLMWGAALAPDTAEIIQRSAEANNRDWAAAPKYSYVERDRTGHGSKTYRVSMILGSPYRELVAVDGRPLPADQQAEEQRKLQQEVDRRRNETPAQHDARVAAYEEGRRRDHLLISQLTAAFNFKLVGRQTIAGRKVYVLQARPKRGYVPPNRDTKVLTGMQGRLWIDSQTFQWVKVEARVIQPVWIEGFVARVYPGTRFGLTYAPVGDDIWEPTHFVMSSHARVLFVFSRHSQANQSYSDYQLQTSAQAVSNGNNNSTR